MKKNEVKGVVRERYSQIAKESQQSCCPGCACEVSPLSQAQAIGYSREDLEHVPEEAILSLGCGNPTAITELKVGKVVPDLGSGAGIYAFLAANKGHQGQGVIGVNTTKEMVAKTKDNSILIE